MLGPLMMLKRGFTLIELLITLSVIGVLVAIAGPSMYEFILTQRLRSINAQLVTDLQFARSEAATNNLFTYFRLSRTSGGLTCYTIFARKSTTPEAVLATFDTNSVNCKCTEANVCNEKANEIRTVLLPADMKVLVTQANGGATEIIRFDPLNGSMNVLSADTLIPEPLPFAIEAEVDAARKLRTVVTPAGRPTVCAPAGSSLSSISCPVPP
jgi:type IV fimbrial biogenesis protein FimT